MSGDALQQLLDRQAIAHCVHRYARGIDRGDAELVASCYHADAIDDHGGFVGLGRDLAGWVFGNLARVVTTQNHITTHNVELDGDTAHGETYYLVIRRDLSGAVISVSGRYVDRFERRGGEWRIAARLTIVDSITEPPAVDMSGRADAPSRRDTTDPSYQRPLVLRTTVQQPHP
ncbi:MULTISPECIES: nuclear transport factor 2 family protein [unclassified Pseudofrankia]|uniref:nuclear transport factor 2 family protein n=1 Tax=unclassified Pseudofrankia TaxID=2994372 RepID=UPI0008D9AF61|nr:MULTISPECIES: nuclear transport factor 2 family protein [unclassified Pseudofrankia]MDT3442231.1 nuclear transport factor 2 family protein [Pseudofrankia sp. BMG5.37]OHV43560.1 hypothetical protein BCD48_27675 [Pseudofrankia sp. BMG5.36]